MIRMRYIRKTAANRWNSATSKRANKARWDADRLRRDSEMPERIAEMQAREIENIPRNQGDVLGVMQWTDFATGKVRRWAISIGDRRDRITFTNSKGDQSKSCGWTQFLTILRKHLV